MSDHELAMSVIIDLDRREAKIVDKAPGFVAVYGWCRELITERGVVPLSELVSVHSFRWTARRDMRRWLRCEFRMVPIDHDGWD